jgi:Predicted pyridoxal phosphate-dependent enzyme apparently involved in regulation of cell wall biogenesis
MISWTRRSFLVKSPALTVATPALGIALGAGAADKPALLGGPKIRSERFPSWPVSGELEERALIETLRSGNWYRGNGQQTKKFEDAYRKLTGARHCLATANGTSALYVSLNALAIEPGDEVIVPPYTFIATINVVLRQYALPVFVDTNINTFQIDAEKIEAAISPRTKAIIPVHLGGSACDLDTILSVSRKHGIAVIEDACQAHLAEWRNRKVGTYGKTGCFSFQASKNLTSGEGGAVLTDDEELYDRCYTFHNNGSGLKAPSGNFAYSGSGDNRRMVEIEAALLLRQMTRLEEQSKRRTANALYLTSLLKEIPGIIPAQMHEGCTRNAYHLYMFRYRNAEFGGLPRKTFLKALAAEGIPASRGYSPLNKEPFLKAALQSRSYQKLFPGSVLSSWEERNECPANNQLCNEAVWFTQNMFLGTKSDMDQIAEAIRKIKKHAGELMTA